MAQPPVVIKLTPEQQALIREASGKNVGTLGIEPVDTGSGWLHMEGEKEFWLLKHSDAKSYRRARRRLHPQIDSTKARFHLKIARSRIHRWGVFAEEQIPGRRHVIEYTGELVNPVEAYLRTKDAGQVYTFKLDDFWRIDGAVGGSGAEFINHSCDPNLRSRWVASRLVFESRRSITAGEELTLDYRFGANAPKVPCRCGSPKCRGTINALKDKSTSRRRS